MSLNDHQTLELNELCNALVDGTLSEQQRARLDNWLADSEDARQFYVKAMNLSASLGYYASEMQMEAADAPRPLSGFAHFGRWLFIAMAASLVLAAGVWIKRWPGPADTSIAADTAEAQAQFVARITGASTSVSGKSAAALKPGAFVSRGQRIELDAGFSEVTFDSGAIVLLEGPAVLEVNSAWDATLLRGALTASVPAQALGFCVSNPAVEVIDVGTEFSMIADELGAAEVFVLKGKVEALPRDAGDSDALVLNTNESRRFASSGISMAHHDAQQLARFRTPVSLESLSEPVHYAHWSFDETTADVFRADAVGIPTESSDLRILTKSPAKIARAHVEGFRGHALRFDGKLVAKCVFPGLASDSPRTVAFWVKVPEDAPLSNAYSMVAWRAGSEKLGSRPVHIGWNRNPTEGPLGAVRTDFSGGHALGTTTLRDGRWHYVSVIFLPGDDPDTPVQVKQYVDGRLESNSVTRGEKLSIAANAIQNDTLVSGDTLWLGCRLGGGGPKRERFVGEIDELFIADGSLEPGEVVQLMDGQEVTFTHREASLPTVSEPITNRSTVTSP